MWRTENINASNRQHPRFRNRGCFWSEPLCSQFAESSPSPSPPVVGILHRCPPLNHNGSNRMREVFPVKYYKDEGFVERKMGFFAYPRKKVQSRITSPKR